jgi:hypothetical protein
MPPETSSSFLYTIYVRKARMELKRDSSRKNSNLTRKSKLPPFKRSIFSGRRLSMPQNQPCFLGTKMPCSLMITLSSEKAVLEALGKGS